MEDFNQIYDELTDEFGDVPKVVLNVMNVAFKISSTELNFSKIIEKEKSIVFKFDLNNKDIINYASKLSDELFRKLNLI